MINYVEYLNVPAKVAIILITVFFIMQIIGEILTIKGKVVPEFANIRKYFLDKKKQKEETTQTLKEVKSLLSEVNSHYSVDNITKRNDWMKWVNDRAEVYDESIIEISEKLANATKALEENTKVTEEMFIQSSRDRIIDFAIRVADKNAMVSREEFNRIFKVHENYENFLEKRGLKNGEIDVNFNIIKEAYEYHVVHHTFAEDIHGYSV